MKYKYILFDLDGTITESGPGIMNSVEYALNKMNREVGERDTFKEIYRTAVDGINGEILWDV